MKALKIIGIVLLVIVVLFFVVALFLPKHFKLEVSETIDQPASMVFRQVNNLHHWEAWSPWQEDDPSMLSIYEGPVLGVGAKQTWESERQGDGEIIIKDSDPYEKVVLNLDFYEMGSATTYFLFDEMDGSTKVTWGFETETTYPVERYVMFVFKGMMKNQFQRGLGNLKDITEQMTAPPEIEQATIPQMTVLTITDSSHWDQIGIKMEEMFSEIMATIQKRNLAMTGSPFSRYFRWDEDNQFAVFEVGVPVDKEIQASGRIESKVLPETLAIKGIHYGPYEKSGEVYESLEIYLMEHGMSEAGGPMEIYTIDPSEEPDTSKWETEIYFPILP